MRSARICVRVAGVAAYRALEAERVVVSRRGSRAVIHPRLARPAPPPGEVARVRALLEHVRTEARLLGLEPEALQTLAAEASVRGAPCRSARV
ncbi:MAG: hypothetical protein IVW57_07665 [Ktedonobacterales bacterium]|nr:hypothetical protein [Ktedonobacterales bacterium]